MQPPPFPRDKVHPAFLFRALPYLQSQIKLFTQQPTYPKYIILRFSSSIFWVSPAAQGGSQDSTGQVMQKQLLNTYGSGPMLVSREQAKQGSYKEPTV